MVEDRQDIWEGKQFGIMNGNVISSIKNLHKVGNNILVTFCVIFRDILDYILFLKV